MCKWLWIWRQSVGFCVTLFVLLTRPLESEVKCLVVIITNILRKQTQILCKHYRTFNSKPFIILMIINLSIASLSHNNNGWIILTFPIAFCKKNTFRPVRTPAVFNWKIPYSYYYYYNIWFIYCLLIELLTKILNSHAQVLKKRTPMLRIVINTQN